jgi:hypothetical protein
MFAVWSVDTGMEATVKVALLVPDVTVTDEGTVAAEVLSLLSDTDVSAATLPVRVTVPVEVTPPATVVGFKDTL